MIVLRLAITPGNDLMNLKWKEMLHALHLRESGLCKPQEVEVVQATQRTYSVDTCKLRDFVNSHQGGVNSLDLEKIEGR